MNKLELTHQLRNNPAVPCNCCQAVLITFAEECGLTEQQARALGAPFAAGMKIGSTCGAITGGLMVLGLLGKGDAVTQSFLRHFRTEHGALNCPDLLRADRERGNTNKKAHCDGLIYEAVTLVEALIAAP